MNERGIRLAGMRQGLGIATLFVLAVSAYNLVQDTGLYFFTQGIFLFLLGLTFIVWGVEEQRKANQFFSKTISGIGALLLATSAFTFYSIH